MSGGGLLPKGICDTHLEVSWFSLFTAAPKAERTGEVRHRSTLGIGGDPGGNVGVKDGVGGILNAYLLVYYTVF